MINEKVKEIIEKEIKMDAIILGGREKAREVFESEIFTLNQYLKDKEMKTLHEKRFNKMLAAMQTAIRIFDWLDEKPKEKKSPVDLKGGGRCG